MAAGVIGGMSTHAKTTEPVRSSQAGNGQAGNTQAGNSQAGNTAKDPDDWTTGDETMTGAQASYLKTLSDEAGEPFDPDLTKAEASKRIDALRQRTGRGVNH